MVTSSSAGTVQLSAQVSECLSLDLSLLHFISASLVRHRAGDLGWFMVRIMSLGWLPFSSVGGILRCLSMSVVRRPWLGSSYWLHRLGLGILCLFRLWGSCFKLSFYEDLPSTSTN